ncbi:Ig-like domain-containing protein [Erythrobacter sp. MTPC3]|uniref:Ig-like domain-containing protein n=1 Tax=Erythrobacter sp. MTPC3 TaxID=3056564 RepID=UPI0036F1CD21
MLLRTILLTGTSVAVFSNAANLNAQSSTESYTYDSLGRLITVVTSGGPNDNQTQSICYDEADNRTEYVTNTSAGATECTGAVPPPSSPPPSPPPPPSNNPPNTTSDTVSGACLATTFVNLTANDSDPEGNYPLTLTGIVRNSGNSDALIYSASTVQVDFDNTSWGMSQFTYTVEDSLGASSTGQLTATTGNCGGGGGGEPR